jgi:hypothetical protein
LGPRSKRLTGRRLEGDRIKQIELWIIVAPVDAIKA